jgi:hypothetical protein
VSPHGGTWVPVRPKRERCKYYKRQILLNDDKKDGEFGRQHICRNCTMRRSIGGAFLSLRDEAVVACDYRDPPDEESVRVHLDEKDKARLDGGEPERVPLFSLPTEG